MNAIQARNIWDVEFSPKSTVAPGHEEIHPDLVRFKGHFYCGFKEGGRSRIIRSADGDKWESVKLFEWEGGHVCDPRLSVTAEGNLMVLTNIQFRKATPKSDDEAGVIGRQSVTWLSSNGVNWGTANASTNIVNTILFDATWYNGMGYCLAYFGKDYQGTLYRTRDGKSWRVLTEKVFPEAHQHGYEEAALAFDPTDGTAYALVRANPVCAIIGVSEGPYYQQWTWRDAEVDWNGVAQPPVARLTRTRPARESPVNSSPGKAARGCRPAAESLGIQLGGPKLLYLKDGRLVAIGRAAASTKTENRGRVTLMWMNPHTARLTPFAKCDGYSHYPGLVEHDGKLWITCSHGTKGHAFNVFMLTMETPD